MQRDPLTATFAALADPTRRAIVERLSRGETSVGELAQPFAMSLPAVSRHLKVLEGAGLIVRVKDAQRRRCRLQPKRLGEAALWIERQRKFWEDRFDALADYLDRVTSETDNESHREDPDAKSANRRDDDAD
jgi:DNA-binding transcriptional ArsR family regulator